MIAWWSPWQFPLLRRSEPVPPSSWNHNRPRPCWRAWEWGLWRGGVCSSTLLSRASGTSSSPTFTKSHYDSELWGAHRDSPYDEMGGIMAGFLRVVARSPQCDIFGLWYSWGPSLQQLKCFISLRCWAWTHKNQNLMTVVTGGPDWHVCWWPAGSGGPGPGRPALGMAAPQPECLASLTALFPPAEGDDSSAFRVAVRLNEIWLPWWLRR